ncbi:unnamed protein product [Ascophyllum nodosum]
MAMSASMMGSFGSVSSSLKDKQRQAVLRLLNFNSTDNGSHAGQVGEWSDQWKVLVYDKPCRNIISTLLHVTQLRKQGVTLHMLLETEREAIPDVPAIYFCRPTEDNMRCIAADAGKRLYSNLYINLSSKLDRPLMELLARETLANSSVDMISKIYDQNLEFVSLENRLFSLDRPGSYVHYNDPTCPDAQIEAYMRTMASALFGVLATVGGVPIIRALPGGPAQMVAEQLSKIISDHLIGGGTSFNAPGAAGFQRPLVVVMHRAMDLVSMLRHNSTYQALVDDVLDHRLNRVTVEMDGKNAQGKRLKTYDVDPEKDSFFRRFKGSPFPRAIEANGSELAAVTQKEEDIRKRTSAAGINADAASAGLGSGGALGAGGGGEEATQELAAAVESLPKLLDQKKGLEMHTNILKAIMDDVAAREVPVYFEVEEEIISAPTKRSKGRVQDLLVSRKGSVRDKLRLLGVYCLATRPSVAELAELEEILKKSAASSGVEGAEQEAERGLGAITYLRKQVSLQHLPMQAGASGEESLSGTNQMFSGLFAKAQTKATGLLAKAAATAGQLLSRANNTHVTRVVESLLDNGEEDEAYLYLDPKLRERADLVAARSRGPPREVIVFMVGGGCYSEYQNLQDFAQRRSQGAPMSVTYGSTELINAEGFLEQLMELGEKQK